MELSQNELMYQWTVSESRRSTSVQGKCAPLTLHGPRRVAEGAKRHPLVVPRKRHIPHCGRLVTLEPQVLQLGQRNLSCGHETTAESQYSA